MHAEQPMRQAACRRFLPGRLFLCLLAGIGWLLAGAAGHGAVLGQAITVRLVAAVTAAAPPARGIDHAVAGVDAAGRVGGGELDDVLPLLRGNLGFSDYRLVSSRRLIIAEGAAAELGDGLRLQIRDIGARHCTIYIFRGAQELLSTRLRLAPGRPLVLGGFPAGDGARTLMVVISP